MAGKGISKLRVLAQQVQGPGFDPEFQAKNKNKQTKIQSTSQMLTTLRQVALWWYNLVSRKV